MLRKGLLKDYNAVINKVFKFTELAILFCSAYLAYYLKVKSLGIDQQYFYFMIVMLIAFYAIGSPFELYKSWRGELLVDELIRVSSFICFYTALITVFLFSFKAGHEFSRIWFFSSILISWILILAERIIIRIVLKRLRRMGFNQRHICAAILDEKSIKLYRKFLTNKDLGIHINSVFSNAPIISKENNFLGALEEIKEYLRINNPDQLWIFGSLRYEDNIRKIIGYAKDKPLSIRYIPELSSLNLLNHSFSNIDGVSVLNIQEPPINTNTKFFMKRLGDVVFSLLFIFIFSPLYLLVALIIKFTSKGPIFYRQVRISYDNKPFYILKFRSMPVGIEKDTGAVWAKEGEQRATRFGSFLRKTSLDEIPQFFNVLKGDMSIVGPRPERPKFVRVFKEQVPGYMKKHMVKAGITGWAQVNGWRGNTDIHKRIEYDLYYINNWSLWFDLKIIFLTVLRGFINKNAY